MAQPLYRQYLSQARRLARIDPTRPKQGNLRRAVSTAYYALFHFFIDQSSRFLVGTAGDRERIRRTLARAYVHAEMAAAAKSFRGGTLPAAISRSVGTLTISTELRVLAACFLDAQDKRHLADYDLAVTFLRDDVIDLIENIEQAVHDWLPTRSDPASQLFLTSLLVWERIRSR